MSQFLSSAHAQALENVAQWIKIHAGQRTPTINDVARLSGVSKRTVSRIINNSSQVKAETSVIVRDVIKAIGFLPNPQARGLAFRHSFLIGLIYDNPNPQYLATIQEGILNALADTEFELAILRCDRSDPEYRNRVLSFVLKQKLFGIILTPSVSEDEQLANMLKEKSCNYLRIAAVELDDIENMIVSNDRDGAREATDYLIKNGHTKIAHVTGRDGFLSTRERLSGYKAALNAAGLDCLPEYLIEGDYTFESGCEAALKLIGFSNRPTAVFAANDEMAAGILQVFSAEGVNVPKDISIVGYDDFKIATSVFPKLTTMRSPSLEIGSMAVWNIIAESNSKKNDSVRLRNTYKPSLIIRDTVAKPRALSSNKEQ